MPHQCEHWFAMTGLPRLRRGDGGTDCHTSDFGHWFAMTTLWQSKDRRETGRLEVRGRGTDREK